MGNGKQYSIFYFEPPKRLEKLLWQKLLEFGLARGFDSFTLSYWGKEELNPQIWDHVASEHVSEDPFVRGFGGCKPFVAEGIFGKRSMNAFLDIYQCNMGFHFFRVYSKKKGLELVVHSYGGIHFNGLTKSQFRPLKRTILGVGWRAVFRTEGGPASYYVLDPAKKLDVQIENTDTDKNKLIWMFLLKLALRTGLEKVKTVYEGGKELEIKLDRHSLNKISGILSEQGLTTCLVYGKPKETSISFKPPVAFSITRLSEPFMPDISSFTTNNKLCISTIKS